MTHLFPRVCGRSYSLAPAAPACEQITLFHTSELITAHCTPVHEHRVALDAVERLLLWRTARTHAKLCPPPPLTALTCGIVAQLVRNLCTRVALPAPACAHLKYVVNFMLILFLRLR